MTLRERVEQALGGSVLVVHGPTGRILAERGLTPQERRAAAVTVTLLDAPPPRKRP